MIRREQQTDTSVVTFPVTEIKHQLDVTDSKLVIEGDPGKSIVRLDSNQIISNVSSDYKIVKHSEVLELTEAAFAKNNLKFKIADIHTGGIAGHRMYINYIFDDFNVDVGGEEYKPFLQIFNSYDKSMVFGNVSGLYRTRCSNGMLLGIRDMVSTRRKHYGKLNIMDEVLKIDEWIESLQAVGQELTKLSSRPFKVAASAYVEDEELNTMLSSIFERKTQQREFLESGLIDEYRGELGDNQYALFNALTDFATHRIEDPDKIRSYDMVRKLQTKITNTFLGELAVA